MPSPSRLMSQEKDFIIWVLPLAYKANKALPSPNPAAIEERGLIGLMTSLLASCFAISKPRRAIPKYLAKVKIKH